MVFLCFRSGRVVITGARARSIVLSIFETVYTTILQRFLEPEGACSNSAVYRHECAHRANTDALLDDIDAPAAKRARTDPTPDAPEDKHATPSI